MHDLKTDHEKARQFHGILRQSRTIQTTQAHVPTNIVFFDIEMTGRTAADFVNEMKQQGVYLFPWTKTQVRAIFHRDVTLRQSREAATRIINHAESLCGAARPPAVLDCFVMQDGRR